MLDVDADVLKLKHAIERLGTAREGKIAVSYGVLFRETSDECALVFLFVLSSTTMKTATATSTTTTTTLNQKPRPFCSPLNTFFSIPSPVEALMGTLRAAKKRGVVHYEGQLLLQGVHDDVDVVLNEASKNEAAGAATGAAAAAATTADVDAPSESENASVAAAADVPPPVNS